MIWHSFRTLTILLLVMFSLLSAESSNEDIVAEGIGLGVNETEAMMAAKRDAVEKGIGMILLSQTEIENFQLKRDQIVTKTLGSVKKYDIIHKRKTADKQIEVKIKAILSRTIMHKDLAAFHILLESMDKPKLMIIINENNIGNDEPSNKAAETAIIQFLKSPYDFEIVDKSVVASIRNSKQQMAKLKDDDAAAATIGSTYGAEVVITGTAVSRVAKELSINLGGMKSVQADITLKAINCNSGRIIATGNGHGAKVHISPNTAGTQAISQASVKAVKKLLDSIIEDWNKQLNNGISLSVGIKNVSTFRQKNNIVQTLRSIAGVSAVRERNWNSDSKLLETDIQYKGNANGFCTKADNYRLKQTGGSLLVTGVNGTRISLSVQVK